LKRLSLLALGGATALAAAMLGGPPAAATPDPSVTATPAAAPASAPGRAAGPGSGRRPFPVHSAVLSARRAPAPAVGAQAQSRELRVPGLNRQLWSAAGVPGASISDGRTALEADGRIVVTLTGTGAAAAVSRVHGSVLAAAGGQVTATVDPIDLRTLAAQPDVSDVAPPARAFAESVTDEGVAAAQADTWQATAGSWQHKGGGTKVAVVDAGFGGTLPAGLAVLPTNNHCGSSVSGSSHGSAVAEIIRQMAPDATIVLYCVLDRVGLAQAENQLQTAGAQVVSCSLAFAPDARGDGTGVSNSAGTSTALTVKKARRAGILWVNSAGNEADSHWSGKLVDANHDSYADLLDSTHDADGVAVDAGTQTSFFLSWDQWPASTLGVNLRLDVWDVDSSPQKLLYTVYGLRQGGLANTPTRAYSVTAPASTNVQVVVSVVDPPHTPALRYDLTYWNPSSSSYFSSLSPATAARAAAGSLAEPASSPYVLTAGAANVASSALEDFSSRGPTVDGRVKPDILGWDGVSSTVYGSPPVGGFYGTSAAAPHVAGAAALVLAANPGLDAAQVEALLESRASGSGNVSPPSNALGHGLLKLGNPALAGIVAPAGDLYTPLGTPVRVVDTRIGSGAPARPLGPDGVISVSPAAAGVPAGASSVVINLAGISATTSTYLATFPGRNPGTSNLVLTPLDPSAAVAAVVPLDAHGNFKVFNKLGKTHVLVDVLGYFSAAGTDGYRGLASPQRIFDSRTTLGGHHSPLRSGEQVKITVLPPTDPDANGSVLINLTVVNQNHPGYLAAYPSTFAHTSTLNYGAYPRANLTVVKLSAGSFELLNSGSRANAVVDVVGYLAPTGTGRFVALPNAVRIGDTRTGVGVQGSGAVSSAPPGVVQNFAVADLNGVPYGAVGAWVGVTAAAVSPSFVVAYPSGTTVPGTSTVNLTPGRTVPNAAVVGLPIESRGQVAIRPQVSSMIVLDLFGYFR
jgi:hypothetical protein